MERECYPRKEVGGELRDRRQRNRRRESEREERGESEEGT
jgi:hypothetical protein